MKQTWPSIPAFVPHRIRRKIRSTRSKLRSRQSPTSVITSLQTSVSPSDTLRSLKHHRWSYYDGQYLFLAILGIFTLCIIQEPGPMIKTLVAALLLTSLLLPLTRQFFLPFLPIAGWIILWYGFQ
jgi:inositol phosphorylceramide synthase catalytic subunit